MKPKTYKSISIAMYLGKRQASGFSFKGKSSEQNHTQILNLEEIQVKLCISMGRERDEIFTNRSVYRSSVVQT